MNNLIFCDLDGTLSDDRPRAGSLKNAYENFKADRKPGVFDDYHFGLDEDEVYHGVNKFLRECIDRKDVLVLITARTERWRTKTLSWLRSQTPGVYSHYTKLIMRGNTDIRRNWELKKSLIKEYILNHWCGDYENIYIVDDDLIVLKKCFDLPVPTNSRLFMIQACNGVLMPYRSAKEPTAPHTGHLSSGRPARPAWPLPPPPPPRAPASHPSEDEAQQDEAQQDEAQQDEGTDAGQRLTVDAALHKLADLYLDRQLVYKSNYKFFGGLMVALEAFVPGGKFRLETEDDWTRMGMLVHVASKLSRYCSNFNCGGHAGSLDDTSVYTQMLNEVEREISTKDST